MRITMSDTEATTTATTTASTADVASKSKPTPNPNSGPQTQKIKEVPPVKEFTGSLLLKAEPVEFCPDSFLDRINYPKGNRPVFILSPLSARDRHWMDSDGRRMSTGGMMWAREHNIDIADKENYVLLIQKFSEYSDWEKRREVVRRSITGFKNGAGIGNFVKAETDDGLHPRVFELLPEELVNAIDLQLMRMASLTGEELLGL